MLDFFILKDFLSFFDNTFSHFHDFFHILVLEFYDFLESLLIHLNHLWILLIHRCLKRGLTNRWLIILTHLVIGWWFKTRILGWLIEIRRLLLLIYIWTKRRRSRDIKLWWNGLRLLRNIWPSKKFFPSILISLNWQLKLRLSHLLIELILIFLLDDLTCWLPFFFFNLILLLLLNWIFASNCWIVAARFK